MENTQYFERYEQQLTEILVEKCTSKGFLKGQPLEVDELNELWQQQAPEYMADAIPEVNNYPAVAMAWAAYFGMGAAARWDENNDFEPLRNNLYASMCAPRGFDEMDEYVAEEILKIDTSSEEYKSLEELLRGCAHTAMTLIRNENVESQSTVAFYVFASTAKVFFRIGVAIELNSRGYAYEKVKVQLPQ